MLSRQDFFNKVELLANEKDNLAILMLFIPHSIPLKDYFSKDEEAILLEKGWKDFSDNFFCSSFSTRLGWRSYFIIAGVEQQDLIQALKGIFNRNKLKNYWRVAFSFLKRGNPNILHSISTFEWMSVKFTDRNTSERFFFINIDEKK